MKAQEQELLKKNWEDLLKFGPRFMGTKGEEKAVDYLCSQLQEQMLSPSIQEFNYQGWTINNDKITLSIEHKAKTRHLTACALLGSGSTENGFIEGKLVYLGSTVIWNMYSWVRFGIVDNNENIIGYVSGRPDGNAISQTLAEGNSSLPHFTIGEEDTKGLIDLISQEEEVIAKGFIQTKEVGEAKGKNIIVRFPSQSIDARKLIVCAHYDTMFNTVGAYDNTSGTAILLALAYKLKGLSLNKDVELIFMSGEEWNLAGSSAYVNELTNEEKQKIDLLINIDGIGRGDIFEAWVGPEVTEREIYSFYNDYSKSNTKKLHIKTPPPPGSDHTPFYNTGIPVCMFTINDQEIIHSSHDVLNEKIYKNMIYSYNLLIGYLNFKKIIGE